MKTLALAFLLFAANPIIIDTTELGESNAVVRTEGGRRVTVRKTTEATIVHVQEGERADTIFLQRDGKVTRTDNGKPRGFVAFDRPHVVVDGLDLEPFLTGDAGERPAPVVPSTPPSGTLRYYACPKDAAMLRVPNAPADASYKCPVDGTVMREAVGPGRQYYLLE